VTVSLDHPVAQLLRPMGSVQRELSERPITDSAAMDDMGIWQETKLIKSLQHSTAIEFLRDKSAIEALGANTVIGALSCSIAER